MRLVFRDERGFQGKARVTLTPYFCRCSFSFLLVNVAIISAHSGHLYLQMIMTSFFVRSRPYEVRNLWNFDRALFVERFRFKCRHFRRVVIELRVVACRRTQQGVGRTFRSENR